jgi:hypothetical protein
VKLTSEMRGHQILVALACKIPLRSRFCHGSLWGYSCIGRLVLRRPFHSEQVLDTLALSAGE